MLGDVRIGSETAAPVRGVAAGLPPITDAPARPGQGGWPDGLSVRDQASSAWLLFCEDSESPRADRHSDEAPILDQLACRAF
jgi:hypothetical protein